MRDNLRDVRLRVGRNVRRLRQLRGLSQEELAELADNAGKHIGRVERGEVNVGLDVLSRIAAALSVDVADLFVGPPRGRRSSYILIPQRALEQIDQVLRGVMPARRMRAPRRSE